jgi:hypothetical protein
MTDNISADIIEMIEAGDLDEALGQIQGACLKRQKILWQDNQPEFKPMQQVKVVGKLRPNYLFGSVFEAIKVNPKTVMVSVPNQPRYRKYAGTQVRIPKSALEVVS